MLHQTQPRDSEGNTINDQGVFLLPLQGEGVRVAINFGVDQVEELPHIVIYDPFSASYFIAYNTTRPGFLSIDIQARGQASSGSPYVTVINGGTITGNTICASGPGTEVCALFSCMHRRLGQRWISCCVGEPQEQQRLIVCTL